MLRFLFGLILVWFWFSNEPLHGIESKGKIESCNTPVEHWEIIIIRGAKIRKISVLCSPFN